MNDCEVDEEEEMTLIRYDTQAGAGGEKRQAHTSVSMRDKSYERGNSSNEDGNNEIGRGGGGGAEQQSDAVTSLQELAAIERVAVAAAAADTTTTTHSLTVMSSRDKLGAAKGRRISALAKAIATRRSAKKKKKMSMSNATASELYTKLVLVLTVTFFLAFFVVIAVSIHISSSIDEKSIHTLMYYIIADYFLQPFETKHVFYM